MLGDELPESTRGGCGALIGVVERELESAEQLRQSPMVVQQGTLRRARCEMLRRREMTMDGDDERGAVVRGRRCEWSGGDLLRVRARFVARREEIVAHGAS